MHPKTYSNEALALAITKTREALAAADAVPEAADQEARHALVVRLAELEGEAAERGFVVP